jgi:quercetin dioxygenase-like cupin family protein
MTGMSCPRTAEHDVVVRVQAAAFTRGELDWAATWTDRAGRGRTPGAGHELSGVVVEPGYATTGLSPGQPVFGLADRTRNDTLAEYTAVEARGLAPPPAAIAHTAAAAPRITGPAARQGAFDHGRLARGHTFLLHGAVGGVGSIAVQRVRKADARVVGAGRDRARALGIDTAAARRSTLRLRSRQAHPGQNDHPPHERLNRRPLMMGIRITGGLLAVATLTAATACSTSGRPTHARGTTAVVASPAAMASNRPTETVTQLLQQALPNVKGKTFTSEIVDFPPKARAVPHRHGQAFVYAYVLEGTVRSQLAGRPVTTYHQGDNWVEPPGAHHLLTENTSPTERARLLVVFVSNTGDKLKIDDQAS